MSWLFRKEISIWSVATGIFISDALNRHGLVTAALVFVVAVLLHVYYDQTHEETK